MKHSTNSISAVRVALLTGAIFTTALPNSDTANDYPTIDTSTFIEMVRSYSRGVNELPCTFVSGKKNHRNSIFVMDLNNEELCDADLDLVDCSELFAHDPDEAVVRLRIWLESRIYLCRKIGKPVVAYIRNASLIGQNRSTGASMLAKHLLNVFVDHFHIAHKHIAFIFEFEDVRNIDPMLLSRLNHEINFDA